MKEKFFFSSDGARIHYFVEGDSDIKLMLIHGWASDSRSFFTIIPVLSKYFTMIIPDLRGFGKSEKKPPFKTKRMIEDMKILAKKEKVDIVAGHSWGGLIAQGVSADENLPLIIMSSFAKWSKPFYGWFFKHLLPIIERLDVEKMINRLKEISYTEKVAEHIESMLKELDLEVLKESGKDILEFDFSKNLEKITQETLIIHGNSDKIVPLKHAFYLKERIKKSELVCVPDAGHDIIETHTRLLASIMVGWVFLNRELSSKI